MLIILEGLVMALWLLIICVVGVANDGPVGLVVFYEKEVQDRVIELGLTTQEKIKRTTLVTGIALFVPVLTLVPVMVYLYNGAQGFLDSFLQMSGIYLIMGLFDRLFIDCYWVNHTNAWVIPGTEDLRPYIYGKTLIYKWIGTLIVFPLFAALIAYIVQLLGA